MQRGECACRLTILATHEENPSQPCGICYVETKSLDGETNLKLKQAMGDTGAFFYDWSNANASVGGISSSSHLSSSRRLCNSSYIRPAVAMRSRLSLIVRCETPNDTIRRFDGAMTNATETDCAEGNRASSGITSTSHDSLSNLSYLSCSNLSLNGNPSNSSPNNNSNNAITKGRDKRDGGDSSSSSSNSNKHGDYGSEGKEGDASKANGRGRGYGYSKGFGYYDKGEGYDANEGKGYGYSKKYGRGYEAGEGERYGHDRDCNYIYIVKAVAVEKFMMKVKSEAG